MKLLIKIFFGFLLLVAIALIGIQLALKFYFTQERLTNLIQPQIKKATGRRTKLGQVSIGLFSGIKLTDLAIKEANGKEDFFKVTAFSLSYKLWPLLHKKLVITSITLDRPYLKIIRQKDGTFNFSKLLTKPAQPAKEIPASQNKTRKALPLDLNVDQISIQHAQLLFEDLKQELPPLQGTIDGQLALSITRGGKIDYTGGLDIKAQAQDDNLKNELKAKVQISPAQIQFTGRLNFGQWSIQSKGAVLDYLQGPKINLTLNSQELDIDQILAKLNPMLTQAAPPGKTPRSSKSSGSTGHHQAKASPLLPGDLAVNVQAKINRVIYRGILAKEVSIVFTVKNGILHLQKDIGSVLAGQVHGQIQADLNKPTLPFKGNIRMQDLMFQQLLTAYLPGKNNYLTGALFCNFNYNGQGTAKLLQELSLNGQYGLSKGQILENPISLSLARLLYIPELQRLSFDSWQGNVKLDKGKLEFKSKFSSPQANATVEQGQVNIVQGRLNIPMTIIFSKKLSKKMISRQPQLKYLFNDQKQALLPLVIKGTIHHPRPTISSKQIKKRIKKEIKKKIKKKLYKVFPNIQFLN